MKAVELLDRKKKKGVVKHKKEGNALPELSSDRSVINRDCRLKSGKQYESEGADTSGGNSTIRVRVLPAPKVMVEPLTEPVPP